jgi:hypothetical protein
MRLDRSPNISHFSAEKHEPVSNKRFCHRSEENILPESTEDVNMIVDADVDGPPQDSSLTSQLVSSVPIWIEVEDSSDDDSVSSIESFDEDCSPRYSNSRSIFNDYWSNDGKTVPKLQRTISTSSTSSPRFQSDPQPLLTHQNVINSELVSPEYELYLKENEEGRTTIPESTTLNDDTVLMEFSPSDYNKGADHSLRGIFAEKYSNSSPCLSSYKYASYSVRKRSSSCGLLVKPPCLRKSSFDSTKCSNSTTSLSKQVVSFDPKVSVHEFDKPTYNRPNDGWSSYFAYDHKF